MTRLDWDRAKRSRVTPRPAPAGGKKKRVSKSDPPTRRQVAFARTLYHERFPGESYTVPEDKQAASDQIESLLKLAPVRHLMPPGRPESWRANAEWMTSQDFAIVEEAMSKKKLRAPAA